MRQLRTYLLFLVILGLFCSSFGYGAAQDGQNGDFRPSEARVALNYSRVLDRLEKAIFGFWQIILYKTRPFLAQSREIVKDRTRIMREEFRKEIDEMKRDCFGLVKFLWDKVTAK